MTKEQRLERAIKRTSSALWHVRVLNKDDEGKKYRHAIRHLKYALNELEDYKPKTNMTYGTI